MARFVKDRNIARNLLKQDGVRQLVDKAARDLADEVERIGGEVSDDYARSVKAVTGKKDRTRHYAQVQVDDDGWLAIEYGNRNTHATAPMRRALENSGLSYYFKGRRRG